MPQSRINKPKTIGECKQDIELITCSMLAKLFASNNGPPPNNTSSALETLSKETSQQTQQLAQAAIEALSKGKRLAEHCPIKLSTVLAQISDQYYSPTYTWDRLFSEGRTAYWQMQLARAMADQDPERITEAWNKLVGTDKTKGTNGTDGTRGDKWDKRGHLGTVGGQSGTDYVNFEDRFPGSIQDEIRVFIEENQGSFTIADIDRELGLTHRQDKKNRSRALAREEKELRIKKDRRVSGKYHILQKDIQFVDLLSVKPEPFSLDLPLGISDRIQIPKKSIIVLAGTSNAGKTAFALETLRRNIGREHDLMYLMSEMGPSEYRSRVEKISDVQSWQENVMAADVSAGFDGPIGRHNPDGLSVVDFLEEVDGEYYKITSDIRSIYEALNEGVALVCLQKHSQASVGRGGEGTTEKARLYLTMDVLHHQPSCTITAIKIIKAKEYTGANPNGQEIHVKIRAGHEIEPISDWMYCNQKQREQYINQYKHMLDAGLDAPKSGDKEVVYRFLLDSGKYGNLRVKDLEQWKQNFSNVDVESILSSLAQWSESKPLKAKGWFFQLSNILEKESKSN